MNKSNNKNSNHGESVPSKKTFTELIDRAISDKSFRKALKSDLIGTLNSIGVKISNPAILSQLKSNLSYTDDVLLADGKGSKIFAVASSASIVAAASTPAFPKGDELDNDHDDK